MAIFHLHVQVISRGSGRSATSAAAYRTGSILHDDRDGKTHDYTVKGRGVMGSFIILPAGAQEALRERSALWNAAEAAERRKDACVAREMDIALPSELDAAGRSATARKMGELLVDRYGVAVEVSLHRPDLAGDRRNYHAHIMFTTREVNADGFGAKTRILDELLNGMGRAEIIALRQAWEKIVNTDLEAAGYDARIDHRSNTARGIALPPQIHEGPASRAMHRQGKKVRESRNVLDFRGREKNYEQIDQGGTRAEYNAEIINLQHYRDVQDEKSKEDTLEDQIEALQERAGEVMGDIAGLQTALESAHLTDDMRSRIRILFERMLSLIFFRKHEEEEHHRLEIRKHAKEKQQELEAIERQITQLRERQRVEQEQVIANRELFSKIFLMPAALNGIPPHVIKMEVPLSSAFNAVAYQVNLKQQSNTQLLQAVLSPPTISDKPAMATVTLRQDVLQVKELLSRVRKPDGQGRQAPPGQVNRIAMRQ